MKNFKTDIQIRKIICKTVVLVKEMKLRSELCSIHKPLSTSKQTEQDPLTYIFLFCLNVVC